jgi:hypothetical protein
VILLEFAAQGIRGVAPAGGRATLRPGYNVVAADGAILRRLLEALFYPAPKDGDAIPRASGGPANAPLRAGLTVVGNDRITYRLVRDFTAGAQLHRFDAEKRSFAPVSQDLTEIAGLMLKTIGVPAPGALGALLAVAASDLPSKQGGGASMPSAAPARPSLTPEQARKRVDALRVELEKAKLAEKLQYQLDGLQARHFKIEEALKGGAKFREELEKAEAARRELDAVAAVAERMGDPAAKIAAYEKASARREEACAKVAAERETIAGAGASAAPRPFWIAPSFWGGAGGGLALLAAGIAGATAKADLRYLSLLDVPAFGWAAWVALRWVSALEGWERIARRKRLVDDWERKVEAQYHRDAAEVREAVKALGVQGPKELKEALDRVADADAVVAEWRRRLAEWEASPDARSALAERGKMEEALRKVEDRISAEVGGFVRDVRSVESELQRLEAEASPPVAAPAAAPAPPPRPQGEPLRALVERAAAELSGSPGAVGRMVAQKASQTLSGISFQRLQGIQVDDRGNVQVQSGGRAAPTMTLAAADRDLVWIALKLAFMEQALAAGKAVAFSEDAFGGLSEGARRFAARLLKQIAKPGQIIHVTADPSFRETADHTA